MIYTIGLGYLCSAVLVMVIRLVQLTKEGNHSEDLLNVPASTGIAYLLGLAAQAVMVYL